MKVKVKEKLYYLQIKVEIRTQSEKKSIKFVDLITLNRSKHSIVTSSTIFLIEFEVGNTKLYTIGKHTC